MFPARFRVTAIPHADLPNNPGHVEKIRFGGSAKLPRPYEASIFTWRAVLVSSVCSGLRSQDWLKKRRVYGGSRPMPAGMLSFYA